MIKSFFGENHWQIGLSQNTLNLLIPSAFPFIMLEVIVNAYDSVMDLLFRDSVMDLLFPIKIKGIFYAYTHVDMESGQGYQTGEAVYWEKRFTSKARAMEFIEAGKSPFGSRYYSSYEPPPFHDLKLERIENSGATFVVWDHTID